MGLEAHWLQVAETVAGRFASLPLPSDAPMREGDRWNSGVVGSRYYAPPFRCLRWVLRDGHWKFMTITEWSRNRPTGDTHVSQTLRKPHTLVEHVRAVSTETTKPSSGTEMSAEHVYEQSPPSEVVHVKDE